MSKHSPLLSENKHLLSKNGVYLNPDVQFAESNLGAELLEDIKRCFAKSTRNALFGDEFSSMSKNDGTLAWLDYRPFHFLRGFDYGQTTNVLDISEDVGGTAHYLAQKVVNVDSVKIDSGIAQLSAIRCASTPNVTIFSSVLTGLSFPTGQYDLIILGQLESLSLSQQNFTSLLQTLRQALSVNGILVINAQNQYRLSKLVNRGFRSVPYTEAYHTSKYSDRIIDLSRRELRREVLSHDFATVDIHATFSKSNFCDQLLSEDYLTSNVHAVNHFNQIGYLDNPEICEHLLFTRFVEEKQSLTEHASRFIVIAGLNKRTVQRFYSNDFTYFGDRALKPARRSITSRQRSSKEVLKRPFLSQSVKAAHGPAEGVQMRPFFKGHILEGQWLQALNNEQDETFENLIKTYRHWLHNHVSNSDGVGITHDSVPHSIIVNARTQDYHGIGLMRLEESSINADFVFFRALFWFAANHRAIFQGYALRNNHYSIASFILHFMPELNSASELDSFADSEQHLRNTAYQNVELTSIFGALHTLNQTSDTHDSEPDPVAEWVDTELCLAQRELEQQRRRLDGYQQEIEAKKQRIEDLTLHRSDLIKVIQDVEDRVDIERNTQGNLYAQINHLEARLQAQHVRNDELHSYLLMRPSTRIKRFLRRWSQRLGGQQDDVAEQPNIENVYADTEVQVPFAELPEGELIGMNTENYELWIQENTLSENDIQHAKAIIEAMPYKPVFSILVPIYNTDPEYLLPMIESVRNQIYPHWQLCLVDDCSPKTYLKQILEQQAIDDERITVKLNGVNQGISVTTNDAVDIATGDYIALLDHDDEITIDALYENAKLINASPNVELIYSDEDKMELDGTRLEPYFKPDYSPDLLDTNNYICHFTVMKKSIMQEIGGFREGLDGSQDHDVILRAARAAAEVGHIPRILYHWRKIPGSTAVEYDSKSYAWEAGRKAIEDLHRQYEDNVSVEFGSLKGSYRLIREIVDKPLVSIVIPFKDKPELLDSCIRSILNLSSYPNYEVIGVSNNSEDTLTHERMVHFSQLDSRIRFIEHNVPFNFSDICNHGVSHAKGDYIVLLNNDIQIVTPDWIQDMLQHAQRKEVGAVGCKLVFPDGRIQHAGVVAGMVGAAGHPHKFFPEEHIGYNGRLHMVSNVSAVTGAMLMVSKDKFWQVGGLDAEHLAVAYNDVDFCLKLIKLGLFNVFTPHAKAIHHESVSRGYEDTDEKMQRLLKEQRHFLSTWQAFLAAGDPFFNPNISLKNERFSLNFKD